MAEQKGANWASHAQTHAGQRREAYTLARLRDLADSEPSLVRHTPFYYVWNVAPGPPVPWFASLTPDVSHSSGLRLMFQMRSMRREEIPEGWKYGRTFTSITLDAPRYLLQMARCLRAQGVEFQRRVFHSLDEARRSTSAHMIINATGLGARSLIGVEDPQVHPVRGQTVLVKAPLVQACYTDFDPHPRASEGHKTYIIPRPGPQGHVILGGTHQPGVFSWLPDSETACRILKEAYKLCPALSNGTGWENIEVISHNVGLRPSRTGEMRLQLEQRAMPASKQSSCQDRVYACVHAYGIGAAG